MKKTIFLFAFFALFTTVASAQTKEYKLAVQNMLSASGAEQTFKASISQIMVMMKQQKPDIPQDFWTVMETEFGATSIRDLIDLLAPIYEKHLTIDDLNQLTAFYQSPVGKKFAQKTPLITQESIQAGQNWGMQLGEKIANKIKEKYN